MAIAGAHCGRDVGSTRPPGHIPWPALRWNGDLPTLPRHGSRLDFPTMIVTPALEGSTRNHTACMISSTADVSCWPAQRHFAAPTPVRVAFLCVGPTVKLPAPAHHIAIVEKDHGHVVGRRDLLGNSARWNHTRRQGPEPISPTRGVVVAKASYLRERTLYC